MKITPSHPASLQDCLKEKLNLSGKKTKALLDTRMVFVNGRRTWNPRVRVKPSDVIEAYESSQPDKKVPVLFENAQVVVLNKPAGVTTQDHPGSLENRARTALALPKLMACHRLDKETSGVIIFAKSNDAFEAIKNQFKQQLVKKMYEAVVTGKKFPKKFTCKKSIAGKSAQTTFELIKLEKFVARYKVTPLTGRTHQIRKHLTTYQLYLLGDKVYGTERIVAPSQRALSRHLLHATNIQFHDPSSNERITVTSSAANLF